MNSDDVTLRNLDNLQAGAAGIAVAGSSVLIENINFIDTATVISEMAVALLNGASDVTIRGGEISSQWFAGIVIDGSHNASLAGSVSNIVIDGVSFTADNGWGHISVEDNVVVDGLRILGNDFQQSTIAVLMNPGVDVTGLVLDTNTAVVETGQGGEDIIGFIGGDQVFTGAVLVGNTFEGIGDGQAGPEGTNLGHIIAPNSADWNGFVFEGNTVAESRGLVFQGSLTDAEIVDNSFTNINDGGYAALQLGRVTADVLVSENLFDRIWAHDTIRVEGTSATDVVIADNELRNLIASVSRSAVRIDAAGTGNVVRDNILFQDLADATLPSHADNHWAIYNSANAASATAAVGWEIHGNSIDGFGGRDRSQAPIVHNARGTLAVWGNTFGPNTRGGVTTDVEHSGYWFFWNVGNTISNNTVQTFRAEDVVLDGTQASFTAVQPANEPANNTATTPVTLHVYWTAADNAEVYLGAITGVTPGQSVSIPTTQTGGFLRLQTEDANGNFSQYSSIDPDAPSMVPAAPVVAAATQTIAAGTGVPGAELLVRNPATDEEFGPVVVEEDGSWTVAGLTCGTPYVTVQTVGGMTSAETPFTTAACPSEGGTGGTGGTGDTGGKLPVSGDASIGGGILGVLALLMLGAGAILFARRRGAA